MKKIWTAVLCLISILGVQADVRRVRLLSRTAVSAERIRGRSAAPFLCAGAVGAHRGAT